MAEEQSPRNVESIEFKKPVFIGKIGKLPKRADTINSKPRQERNLINTEISSEESEKSKVVADSNTKVINTPIPYKEPKWSGLCPDGSGYALEVLKSGMILEHIELTNQAYYVFGRLVNCDIVLSHPSASRHHAVLQYKAFAEEGKPPSGWYIYDLGSTHGTFHNGVRLKPEYFSRVRVGHQIKFGTSSRIYIMMGPDYDCEGESDLTVTEIKQKAQEMKLARERMVQDALKQKETDRLETEKKLEEQGIDWGMGEDAEEEPDLADNPYAVAANEELYLDDPKKTLRGYFEREGHELTYNCEERGVGQFLCRVELPLDDARGKPVVAEVVHRGKKKEAVVACALEACRVLDRAGLLRQAKHESRRRKQRDWGADDFYDSDEDTFLDRTGSVENKRNNRMRRHGALPPEERQPRTYEDLLKEIAEIERKIAAEERVLERLRESGKQVTEVKNSEDALDEYMSSLGKQGQTMGQKAEISNAKLTIQKLKGELSKSHRLAELARPADAPPLVKKDEKRLVKLSNSVVYGKRIKLKDDMDRKPKPRKEIKREESEFVEEVDSDEEVTQDNGNETKKCSTGKGQVVKDEPTKIEVDEKTSNRIESTAKVERHRDNKSEEDNDDVSKGDLITEKKTQVHNIRENKHLDLHKEQKQKNKGEDTEDKTKVKRVFGPMRPPENYVIPDSYFDQETDRDLPEIEEKETI